MKNNENQLEIQTIVDADAFGYNDARLYKNMNTCNNK